MSEDKIYTKEDMDYAIKGVRDQYGEEIESLKDTIKDLMEEINYLRDQIER